MATATRSESTSNLNFTRHHAHRAVCFLDIAGYLNVVMAGRFWESRRPHRSDFHHGSSDDVVAPHESQKLVDLLESDGLDGVLDLAFGGERHDLAEVRIVAPEGPMEGLLARHAREERDVDAITN